MRAGYRYRHRRDLLVELVARDLKVRYQRSLIGIGWSLLRPIMLLVTLSIVFSHILPLGIEHYTSFVFAGVLAWTWFSSALNAATASVTASKELVRRPGFPLVVLPSLAVVGQGIHFALALPLLIGCAIVQTGFAGLPMIALPLVIALQLVMMLGLAYLLAAIYVFMRDIEHLLTLVLTIGFYITPVFYRPIQRTHDFAFITTWNPVAWLLQCYRTILIDHDWPPPLLMAQLFLLGVVLLAAGLIVYTRCSRRFEELL